MNQIIGTDGTVLFQTPELACRHCGVIHFLPGFSAALRHLREDFGRPMKVNSCCRCPEYNAEIGGHPRSLHLMSGGRAAGTCAIDIAVPNGSYRGTLTEYAYAQGWSVGHYKTFVHLDRRVDIGLVQQMFWGGY